MWLFSFVVSCMCEMHEKKILLSTPVTHCLDMDIRPQFSSPFLSASYPFPPLYLFSFLLPTSLPRSLPSVYSSFLLPHPLHPLGTRSASGTSLPTTSPSITPQPPSEEGSLLFGPIILILGMAGLLTLLLVVMVFAILWYVCTCPTGTVFCSTWFCYLHFSATLPAQPP